MEIRPFSSRPNLCTVIDFANAKAARAVGLPTDAHVFQVHDLVALRGRRAGADPGIQGHFALVALAGLGINRAAALSSMRKLPEPGGAA
jgi:ribosomal protein S12